MVAYDPDAKCARCNKTFTQAEWDRAQKVFEGTVLVQICHMNCYLTPEGQEPMQEEKSITYPKGITNE
jgi:hypothetical protein